MKRHFKSALFALALGATASNAYAAETSDCELLLVQIIQSHDGNGEAQVPSYVPAEEFMASLEDDKPGHMTEHLDHKIQAVMCRRNDILPRLEDYTILATGIPFILSQDFDSSDTDSLTLYWKDEAIQHIYKGYPLSEEAESVLETRLTEFSKQGLSKTTDTKSDIKSREVMTDDFENMTTDADADIQIENDDRLALDTPLEIEFTTESEE